MDLPPNLTQGDLDFAQTNDFHLASVLNTLTFGFSLVNLVAIIQHNMRDLRPLLKSGEYDKVVKAVRQRISRSECIP
jgi:hypothetical protein